MGKPGYEGALEAWHHTQAMNALQLGQIQRGDRVLEIGCRHGRTMMLMRDLMGIQPFGIEPGPEEAKQAEEAGG